jgi:hypothetical protein
VVHTGEISPGQKLTVARLACIETHSFRARTSWVKGGRPGERAFDKNQGQYNTENGLTSRHSCIGYSRDRGDVPNYDDSYGHYSRPIRAIQPK